MSKKYNKNYFKELREKSLLHYESIPALNWGATHNDVYQLNNRYHFVWKTQNVSTGGIHPINKDIKEYIKDFVEKNKTVNEFKLSGNKERKRKITAYIGVDSQNYLSYTRFVAIIALYVEKNGAHLLISRSDLPKIYDYRYKLLREIDVLGELARNFKDFFKSIDVDFELHADLNNSANHKSNGVVEEATNYIKYLGFNLKIKDESFAATHAADYFCK
jgi:predicted RNase H-related nuclease YkuK (DUF458 family)